PTLAGSVARATAGAEQVVSGSAREERPAPVGVVATLSDVLAGYPDRVAIHDCGAVVAPASTRRISDLRLVAGESVGLRGTGAAIDHVPRADAGDRVDRRKGSARVKVVTRRGKGNHTAPARGDGNRRVGEVIPGGADIVLHDDLARVRIDNEPGDAGARRATVRVERRIERAPQLAVRVGHLLHAGVVRVGPRDNLVVCRLAAEQKSPAARLPVKQQRRRVVDAVTLRCSYNRQR